MAQYITDFTEYTVGQPPHDWTAWIDGGIGDITVRESGGVRFLRKSPLAAEGGYRHAFTWSAVPSVADVKIYSEFETDPTTGRNQLHVCRLDPSKNDDRPTTHLYLVGANSQDSQAGLEIYNNGAYSASGVSPFTYVRSTRYCQLTHVVGNQVKVWVWEKAGAEPTTPVWEGTDSTIATAGLVGIGGWSPGGDVRYYVYSVATGGDDPLREKPPGPAVTLDQTTLTPGSAISGSYANFEGVPVSPLTLTDSNDNSITVAVTVSDNGDGTGTFTGTLPDLPSSGTATLLMFGTVTVTLD